MLVDAVRQATLDPRAKVLDVCSAGGAVAVAAAARGVRSATAVDAYRRAVWATRLNARLNRVSVRALHGDLFEPVGRERFDLITANPPCVPGIDGEHGRAVLDRLIEGLREHLAPGGAALLAQSAVTGTQETLDALTRAGLEPRIVQRRRGPLGPVLARRVDYLIDRGLLRGPHLEEELLIIGAELGAPRSVPLLHGVRRVARQSYS